MRVRYSHTDVVTGIQGMLTPPPPPYSTFVAKAGILHKNKKYNPLLPLGRAI